MGESENENLKSAEERADSSSPLGPISPASSDEAQVRCPHCGHSYPVKLSMPLSNAICPKCGKGITEPSTSAETPSPTQAVSTTGVSLGKPIGPQEDGGDPPPVSESPAFEDVGKPLLKKKETCPACNGVIQDEGVFCVACGFSLTKEEYIPVKKTKKTFSLRPILLPAAVIVFGIAAYFAWQKLKTPREAPPGKTTAAPPESPPTLSPAEQTRIRDAVTKKLDAQHPPATPGDEIVLKTRDGKILSGVYYLKDKVVSLYQDGTTVEIPAHHLDQSSRSRIDPAYREHHIERLANMPPHRPGITVKGSP